MKNCLGVMKSVGIQEKWHLPVGKILSQHWDGGLNGEKIQTRAENNQNIYVKFVQLLRDMDISPIYTHGISYFLTYLDSMM